MKSPNKLALILLCGVLAVNSVVAMDEVANIGFDFSDVVTSSVKKAATETVAEAAVETVAEAAKTGWMQSARQFGASIANSLASAASSVANSTAGQWVQEHPYMTAGAVGAVGLGGYGVRRYMQNRNKDDEENESSLVKCISNKKTMALGTAVVAAGAASWYTGYTPAYLWNNVVPSREAIGTGVAALYNAVPSREAIEKNASVVYDALPSREAIGTSVSALYDALPSREAIEKNASALYDAVPSMGVITTPVGNVLSSVWSRVPEQTSQVIAAEAVLAGAVTAVAFVDYKRRDPSKEDDNSKALKGDVRPAVDQSEQNLVNDSRAEEAASLHSIMEECISKINQGREKLCAAAAEGENFLLSERLELVEALRLGAESVANLTKLGIDESDKYQLAVAYRDAIEAAVCKFQDTLSQVSNIN